MVLKVPLSVVLEVPLFVVLQILAVPGAADAGKPLGRCSNTPSTHTRSQQGAAEGHCFSAVLQRSVATFCPIKPQLSGFLGSRLLSPRLSCPRDPEVCSDPGSRLFRAAGNTWNTEFLHVSASNLQMLVAASSHSLLWLGAHICIALCIPSGPGSRGEMPVFLEW